jgi:hypothetical protein
MYSGELYAGLAFRKSDSDSTLVLEAQYNQAQEYLVRETTVNIEEMRTWRKKRGSPSVRVGFIAAADLRKKITTEGWEVDWHTRVSDLKR